VRKSSSTSALKQLADVAGKERFKFAVALSLTEIIYATIFARL